MSEDQQINFTNIGFWEVPGNVLHNISIVLLSIIETSINYMLLVEWHSMLFIIQTQKNRPIEEILYDHENEQMG